MAIKLQQGVLIILYHTRKHHKKKALFTWTWKGLSIISVLLTAHVCFWETEINYELLIISRLDKTSGKLIRQNKFFQKDWQLVWKKFSRRASIPWGSNKHTTWGDVRTHYNLSESEQFLRSRNLVNAKRSSIDGGLLLFQSCGHVLKVQVGDFISISQIFLNIWARQLIINRYVLMSILQDIHLYGDFQLAVSRANLPTCSLFHKFFCNGFTVAQKKQAKISNINVFDGLKRFKR